MTWVNGNEKCSNLGMRLPTIDELKEAHDTGIWVSWYIHSKYYWSSIPDDADKYYVLDISDNKAFRFDRTKFVNVRCHQY